MDMTAERQMSPLRMSPMMRNMYRADQAMGPNQYFLQDKFGNYAYAFANQNSEKMEKGDQNSVKGHFAYIMSNGQKRRVDYIADNQGFHVIRDDADNAGRFKRSVEPDLIQTKMTSYMDSSSLRDASRDMNRMISPNMMYRNNQMGRNMYMNNDMTSQMVNRNMMYSNMLSQNMPNNMMNMNSRDMMSNNMMNSRDMMDNQMMGQDMMQGNMNMMNSYANNELMVQNRNMMHQRMEIEQI